MSNTTSPTWDIQGEGNAKTALHQGVGKGRTASRIVRPSWSGVRTGRCAGSVHLAAAVSRAKAYDAKALYMQGLMAFGQFFSFPGTRLGRVNSKSHLTNKQARGRKAFKKQRIARRAQRRAS